MEKRSRDLGLTVRSSDGSERLCESITTLSPEMLRIVLHGTAAAEEALPMAFDAAVLALVVGTVVFGLIAYDAYRVHWR